METVYFNGDILTMEQAMETDAVLVRNGRIAATGSRRVMAERDSNACLVDLQGAAMMPAFIDSHSHITALAQTYGMADLSGAKDFEGILQRLRQFKEENHVSEGQWLLGYGYDQERLKEKRPPDKELLDRTGPNPVLISHVSGHAGVANSAGLVKLGITAETPDPEGGKIGRNASSKEPNGYLEESAFTALDTSLLYPPPEQRLWMLRRAQQEYLRYGITTVQDGLTRDAEWTLLRKASEAGELLMDVVCYIDQKLCGQLLWENPLWTRQYLRHLRIGGYKIILDGSPQARTAWMSQPYMGAADYRGYPAHSDAQVASFFETVIRDSMQVLVHCNGDAAAEQMISVWETLSNNLNLGLRPTMIHAQFVRQDQLRRMERLGIIASFFIAHISHWAKIHQKNLGRERACRMSPVATALREGTVYTFHQDTPVTPPDMLETVWLAVNRRDCNNEPVGSYECIPVSEALRGVTINAAYQYFEEQEKGSIRVGKKADLIILNRSPLKVAPMQIKEIKILQTIKEGNVLFCASDNQHRIVDNIGL